MLSRTTALRTAILSIALIALASRTSAQDVNEPVGGKVTLPENPCYILTMSQVARASGVEVVDAKRVPAKGQTDGKPGPICSYDTKSDFGAITIVIPPPPDQSSANYRERRDAYFRDFAGSAQKITGLGQDAWLGGGASLTVLAGDDVVFSVNTQNYQPTSRELLVEVAKAVLRRAKS